MMNSKKMKQVFIGVAVILVMLLIYVQLQTEEEVETLTQKLQSEHQTFDEDDQVRVQKTVPSEKILPYKSKYGPLPGSLEGTIMNQALVVDEEGNLRISNDLKRIFDFFLSTIEEEKLDTILNRIKEYLAYSLQEPALGQANEIMTQYVSLKKALFDFELERSDSLRVLMEQGGTNKGEVYLGLLKEQLDAQRDLRSLHLSPEVHEAFYADDEAYDSYSLARMEVNVDKTLSEEEKQQRFDEIDAQAPSEIVESRKNAQVTDVLKQKTQLLREQGASQQEIRSLRTEMLGAEAADRFEVLDQQRAEWSQRIDSYLQKRKEVLEIPGLSEVEKQAQLTAYKRAQFDEREQLRLGVYERKADAVK